jgi:hypothetical protein
LHFDHLEGGGVFFDETFDTLVHELRGVVTIHVVIESKLLGVFLQIILGEGSYGKLPKTDRLMGRQQST